MTDQEQFERTLVSLLMTPGPTSSDVPYNIVDALLAHTEATREIAQALTRIAGELAALREGPQRVE